MLPKHRPIIFSFPPLAQGSQYTSSLALALPRIGYSNDLAHLLRGQVAWFFYMVRGILHWSFFNLSNSRTVDGHGDRGIE